MARLGAGAPLGRRHGVFRLGDRRALPRPRPRTGCGRSRCAARASPRGPSPFSPAPWPWCPPADPGDLSPLLPPCVTWYDRAQRRFLDPCACLCERDAAFLTARLALLCRLNEQPSLRSPLYDPAAGLCGVLRPFLTDISRARGAWRDLLSRGDAQALDDLRARILAAHTLADTPAGVREETLHPQEADPAANPLLRVVLGPVPPAAEGGGCVLYSLDGAAFARRSAFCLAEPRAAPAKRTRWRA